MKRFFTISKLLVVCFLIVGAPGFAAVQKLPLFDGKETVAIVNDEPITLEEFNQTIAASHEGKSEKQKAGRIDFSGIMERLITIKLILIEARNMGLDELPKIKKMVETYSKETKMELLLEQHVKDITADEGEIVRLYKEETKEWKIKEIKFQKEADAKKIQSRIKAGEGFDTTAKKAVAEGVAEYVEEEYLKAKDFKPRVAQLISKMEINDVSPVISAGKKTFIIFKLESIRYPKQEDSEAMKKARQKALDQKRVRAAKDYYSDLKKKYVIINQELFDALDYESKTPGFENLLKDDRIVAEIIGEKPITVGEFSRTLKNKFYHGIKQAVESKRVNKKKKEVFESILEKRVLIKEASIQGVNKTEAYETRVKDYENSIIFGAFIDKAVAPEIKLNEKELKAYYTKNSEKYTTPKMMRIKSLVFEKRSDAVEALGKLVKGTDFNWMSFHADGQVDKTEKGLLQFKGRMLILNTMPEDVQKVVSNAKPGDFRLYASPEGHFYVLYIYHVVEPKLKPFDDVKKEITEKVYNDKIKETVEIWADKLKEYYPVKIYRKDLMK